MNLIYDVAEARARVADLWAQKVKVYVSATGGGAGLQDLLWSVPGASAALLGANFPYSQEDFRAFVGENWSQVGSGACSQDAAVALAQSAYLHAQRLQAARGDLKTPVVGLGLTCALATSRVLRGGTRAHAAVRFGDSLYAAEVQMKQGVLSREDEGRVCDALGLRLLLHAAGLPPVTVHGDSFDAVGVDLKAPEVRGLKGPLLIKPSGTVTYPMNLQDTILFPGSFNPLTFGHEAIAKAVSALTKKPVVFEITAKNVDKEHGTLESIAPRALQFRGRWHVVLRDDAALFIDKARAHPGVSFALGADTAARLLAPAYYNGDPDLLRKIMGEFLSLGTTFYVFDRGDLAGVDWIPEAYRPLFQHVQGRWDISSSAVREAQGRSA